MQDLLKEMESQNIQKFIKVEDYEQTNTNKVMSDTESEKERQKRVQLFQYGQYKQDFAQLQASQMQQQEELQAKSQQLQQQQQQQTNQLQKIQSQKSRFIPKVTYEKEAMKNAVSVEQRQSLSQRGQDILKYGGMRNACGQCSRGFVRSSDLSTHIINIHKRVIPLGTIRNGLEEKNDYIQKKPIIPVVSSAQVLKLPINIYLNKCGGCGQIFQSLAELTKHILCSHDKVVPTGSIAQGQPFTREFIMANQQNQERIAGTSLQSRVPLQNAASLQNQNNLGSPFQSLVKRIQQLSDALTEEDREKCGICIGFMLITNQQQAHHKFCPAHKELFHTFEFWNKIPNINELQSLLYIAYKDNINFKTTRRKENVAEEDKSSHKFGVQNGGKQIDGSLAKEMNTHMCTQCEKQYEDAYKLEKHKRIRHTDQTDKKQ